MEDIYFPDKAAIASLKSNGTFNMGWGLMEKLPFVEAGLLAYYIEKYDQFSHSPRFNGWFYLTHDKIVKKLNIRLNTVIKTKQKFIDYGFFTTKTLGVPSKQWIFINLNVILNFIYDDVSRPIKNNNLDPDKVGVYLNKLNINKKRNLKVSSSDFDKSDHDNQNESFNISSGLVIKRNKPPKIKKEKQSIKEEVPNLNRPVKPSDFDYVWDFYDLKKSAKIESIKAWNKVCNLKKDLKPTLLTIIRAIRGHKTTVQWSIDKKQPILSAWLNQAKWELSKEEVDRRYGIVIQKQTYKTIPRNYVNNDLERILISKKRKINE